MSEEITKQNKNARRSGRRWARQAKRSEKNRLLLQNGTKEEKNKL